MVQGSHLVHEAAAAAAAAAQKRHNPCFQGLQRTVRWPHEQQWMDRNLQEEPAALFESMVLFFATFSLLQHHLLVHSENPETRYNSIHLFPVINHSAAY